jgi:peptidoglycan/xylan/chitin deacetylase (PgdA/CDA1 family)
VSFTFDDFPRTALVGAKILETYGVAGTFFVSLGLLGKDSPSGPICTAEDLRALRQRGHELGCHTYSHCHSWDTSPVDFELSILQNRKALREIIADAEFRSLSYPKSEPRPHTKRLTSRHFSCCRAGGQTLNSGTIDLNQLSAFFIEQSKGCFQPIRDLIDRNREERGWLIFATHDVCPNSSRFGSTPEFFTQVVQYSLESGARILPMIQALDSMRDIN